MSHTNFLGIPVDGDITPTAKRAAQRPQIEFEPFVRVLLDDPTIEEFGWYQYTPYFNDGEPCEFGARSLWVRTIADKATAEHPEDDESDEHEDLEVWGNHHPTLKGESLSNAKALEAAVDGGQFDDVLMELFGDHAEITVRRDGISVSFYEHD